MASRSNIDEPDICFDDVEKGMEELYNKLESLLQESEKMEDETVGLQGRIVGLYGKLGAAKLDVAKTLDELEEFEAKAANENAALEAQALEARQAREAQAPRLAGREDKEQSQPGKEKDVSVQGRDSSPPHPPP